MKNFIKGIFKHYCLPRWIILAYDLLVIGIICIFSTFLIENFSAEKIQLITIFQRATVNILICLLVYLHIKPHHNIIRHTTLKGLFSLVKANTLGSIVLLGLSLSFGTNPIIRDYLLPYPVIIINFFIQSLFYSAPGY